MQTRAEQAIEYLTQFFATDAHLSAQAEAQARAVVDEPVRAAQRRLNFEVKGHDDERHH